MLQRFCLALCCLLCLSCGDPFSVTHKYCDLPARFTFNPVSSVSQLFSACNSMGQWCLVTSTASQFIFQNTEGSTPVNRTAASNYTDFYFGLAGFVVGLPNIPEIGSDLPIVTCYDRACRNCYEQNHVIKPVYLQTGGYAICHKCERSYNLNDQGLVARGPAGKALYRYRVNYAPSSNTLIIHNVGGSR